MKLLVECPMRFLHQNIIKALEENLQPKYQYLGNSEKNKFALLFETDSANKDNIADITKKIIKDSPTGKTAAVRIEVEE